MSRPLLFEEYFEKGKRETASPFLTPLSRPWSAYLTLKAALLATFLLIVAFFSPPSIGHFLLVFVYFLVGVPALIESLEDLLSLEVNIDTLMTLAAFSSILIGSSFEGALLLVLFALSGAMEDAVTDRAKGAISSLRKLSPTRALVLPPDGPPVERNLAQVHVGDTIRVRANQLVPLDGTVIDGISSLNLVHLTGESLPVPATIGDTVPAGARNLDGALTLTVTRTQADSTLARIIQLVTQAQEAKPQLQRWFDSVSRRYALAIIGFSAFFALALTPFLGATPALYRALTFLIAASPCALIIAIPIAYLSAVGACARSGILLKGGITLDALAACNAIAFDKTGTLTTGQLECLGYETLTPGPYTHDEILAAALALESNAVHPIAQAICTLAGNIPPASLSHFRSIPGQGLTATIYSQDTYIGRADDIPHAPGQLIALLKIGSARYLFRFQDQIRPDLAPTLHSLRHTWHMRLIMLTGDHLANAKPVAKSLHIDEVIADMRPEDKLDTVHSLAQTHTLAMIGDGVNDAPALARAHVGICMGQVGSTPAIDAADIILLRDNLTDLDWLVAKSHKLQQIARQNLFFASAAILIASLPALLGIIPLWLAVVLHEGGTVLVGLNGLRLLRH